MKQFIAIFLLCIISSLAATAADADTVSLRFRQSHINIEPSLSGNSRALDSLKSHSLHRGITSVKVTGAASPEGSVSFNDYLSRERARAIFDYFNNQGWTADSVATSFAFLGRDWGGLQRLVAADPRVPAQSEVLTLLDKINSSTPPRHPLAELKKLHGGVPYLYMYQHLFPQLRASWLEVEYAPALPSVAAIPPEPVNQIDIVTATPTPEMITLEALPQPAKCRPFYMALKANLLYDALLLPTVGAEFYVGKGWSVLADWTYGWWDRDRTHYYWRAYGGNLGFRKWFGRKAAEKPLTGHHIGAFAGVITYDFELGGTGYMGGLPGRTLWDRCNYVCGIEYGYSLPIARRLNLDFSIALGYIGGKYIKYAPKDGFYQWQSTKRLNWVGPTKAEVSLVWLIGCDNYNRRKGGVR